REPTHIPVALRTTLESVRVHAVANPPRRGLFQDVGCGEVREPLSQVDRPVLAREAGHTADDRLGERMGTSGRVHGRGSYKAKAPAKQPGALNLPGKPPPQPTEGSQT